MQSTTSKQPFEGWSDKQRELATKLAQHKADSGKSWPAIAKLAQSSDSVMAQFSKGTYPSPDSIQERVQKYFDGLEDARNIDMFDEITETRTLEEIKTTFRYAQAMSTITVITGAPGIGKTVACRQYCKEGNNRWMITASPAISSVKAIMMMIVRSIGIPLASNNADNAINIAERLSGTKGMLIVDEAQHLQKASIEELRSLFDATNSTVSIALVGNAKVGTAFKDTTTRADFAQIRSRIGLRFTRDRALRGDAHKLAELWGLEAHRDIIWHIAKKDGGLRWSAQMAKLATTMAAGEAVTAEHMKTAWQSVGEDAA